VADALVRGDRRTTTAPVVGLGLDASPALGANCCSRTRPGSRPGGTRARAVRKASSLGAVASATS